MSVIGLMTQPCTVLQEQPSVDDYDSTPTTPLELETVCHLEQTAATEGFEGEAEESEWRAFLPGSVDLRGQDRIEIGGSMFELAGDPWPVRNARLGTISHLEVRLKRLAP